MSITLPAVCKGDTLMLLQPLEGFPEGTPVSVTITPESEREFWLKAGDEHFATASDGEEREEWERFSSSGLAAAYGSDEPEYTLNDLVPDAEA